MADTQSRLERRIRHDFPEPGSARGVIRLLADLPHRAGYDQQTLASERIQAAIILLADGNLRRLHEALDLAAADWRDLLVAAGLADEDWPGRLDRELSAGLWRTRRVCPDARRGSPYQAQSSFCAGMYGRSVTR